ncbi:hypothetical protein ES332_D04G215100v1 [Gossypium tomentosum]|uniref:TF-B3 domain-containing protein n=1 Tax=Gossypium tomentosum TaxID=34277 RepID=A0A5D2LGI7_GOSTO|nr:hypothetical protein ES332_D04G215100v1 [Gossypium tomentosum]
MAIEKELFKKRLTKTDVEKRLSIPSRNKKCFLNFRGKHMAEFKVKDKHGKEWKFNCSTRKKDYPKPVLTSGWLLFVQWWNLAVGDEVKVYGKMDQAGEEHYRIEVAVATDSTADGTVNDDQTETHFFEFISLKPDLNVGKSKLIN